MKRKLTTLLLTLALTLGLTPALASETLFPLTVTMPAFPDVSPSGTPGGVWYDYQSVKISVESGLMKGTGTHFTPGGALTIAEVSMIAARINQAITGYAVPAQEKGSPWYSPALAVMEHLGISTGNDPGAKATRSDFVRILNAVLPDEMMKPINTITTLPDSTQADVLRFYNAGLLTGKDAYGTFDGQGGLLRAEVAAMVARIVDPSLRKSFTPAYNPGPLPEPEKEIPPSPTPATGPSDNTSADLVADSTTESAT